MGNFVGSGAGRWADIILTQPGEVTAGTSYAIVVSSANIPSSGLYIWSASYNDPYSWGDALRPETGGQWSYWSNNGVKMDFAFKTFVDGVVPGGTPTVASTSPAEAAANVDRDANIKALFSTKMKEKTINSKSVRLHEGITNGNSPCATSPCVPAQVRYNTTKKQVTLDPSQRLKANTRYTAVIEGAGDDDTLAVKDGAGKGMARDYIWHFTTGSE